MTPNTRDRSILSPRPGVIVECRIDSQCPAGNFLIPSFQGQRPAVVQNRPSGGGSRSKGDRRGLPWERLAMPGHLHRHVGMRSETRAPAHAMHTPAYGARTFSSQSATDGTVACTATKPPPASYIHAPSSCSLHWLQHGVSMAAPLPPSCGGAQSLAIVGRARDRA